MDFFNQLLSKAQNMSTLPPPGVNEFPADSIEKQVYGIVENFKDYLPIPNDRNRLGYNLYKFVLGEGDEPKILLRSAKVKIVGIKYDDLVSKFDEALKSVKKPA